MRALRYPPSYCPLKFFSYLLPKKYMHMVKRNCSIYLDTKFIMLYKTDLKNRNFILIYKKSMTRWAKLSDEVPNFTTS